MSDPLFLKLPSLPSSSVSTLFPSCPGFRENLSILLPYLSLSYTGLNSDWLGWGYIVNTAHPLLACLTLCQDTPQVWMEWSFGLAEEL